MIIRELRETKLEMYNSKIRIINQLDLVQMVRDMELTSRSMETRKSLKLMLDQPESQVVNHSRKIRVKRD